MPTLLARPLCNMCRQPAKMVSKGSLLEGLYRCQPCRRIESMSEVKLPCRVCGAVVRRQRRHVGKAAYCGMACFNRRPERVQRGGPDKVKRAARFTAAPGLSSRGIDALRRRWARQGRLCTYCQRRPGNTIDHVVPLVRGGTNFEGNLVPACRACNSSKCGRLLVEWRFARQIA